MPKFDIWIEGLLAAPENSPGADSAWELPNDWTTYRPPPEMNATSSTPPLPAAITGWEDAPGSEASICWGRPKNPPSNLETNTRGVPPTFLT